MLEPQHLGNEYSIAVIIFTMPCIYKRPAKGLVKGVFPCTHRQ